MVHPGGGQSRFFCLMTMGYTVLRLGLNKYTEFNIKNDITKISFIQKIKFYVVFILFTNCLS